MKATTDRNDNLIGSGNYHVEHTVYDFPEFPSIQSTVTESNTSETVYIRYANRENGRNVTVRFSWHINNAVEFGDQLDGNTTSRDEVLYRLGLMRRTFIPNSFLFIGKRMVKKSAMKNYEEADLTIGEMYELGEDADLSRFVGKLAKGSNYLITSSKVDKVLESRTDRLGNTVYCGKYIYEQL